MNRFQILFANNTNKVLIPYFTLGDPTPKKSLALIKQIISEGAEALELGIPFSDPVADGPTNQRAMQRALAAGMNFDRALELISEIRCTYPHLPIGLLIYYNLIFRRGVERAYQDLAAAGADAIVCAELPLEESEPHEILLRKHHLGCVHMIFPNTSLLRAKQSLERSTAFTYVVARSGITGASEQLSTELMSRLQTLRELHNSPLVVGFGLSKPEHVHAVHEAGANGAIVASRFAEWIEQNPNHLDSVAYQIIGFMNQVKTYSIKK